MSDTTRPARDGQQSDSTIAVQPREIKEAAFRCLCTAGADPLEAREGALAVLRAEADKHAGLSLLADLLDQDWGTFVRPSATQDDSRGQATLRELDCAGQPPLRTALQLLDLAAATPADDVCVIHARDAHVPDLLWHDLLLRHAAAQKHRIVITASKPGAGPEDEDAANYLTIRDGALTAIPTPAPEVVNALVPRTARNSIVLMALPEPVHPNPETTLISPKALKMREKDWQSMYQMSRKYLVPDA